MRKEEYAMAMCQALLDFSSCYPSSSLRLIRLVDIDPVTSIVLENFAEQVLVAQGAKRQTGSMKEEGFQAQMSGVHHAGSSTGTSAARRGVSETVAPAKGKDYIPVADRPRDERRPRSRPSSVHDTSEPDPRLKDDEAFKSLAASEIVRGRASKVPGKAVPVVKEEEWREKEHRPPTREAWTPLPTCPICMSDITEEKTLPRCKHKFCKVISTCSRNCFHVTNWDVCMHICVKLCVQN